VAAGRCTGCGKCFEVCRFEAVVRNGNGNVPVVDGVACEGCGVCAYFCPEQAIEFSPVVNGEWYVSDTRYGRLVHARLEAGAENSGKLVSLVRSRARKIAQEQGLELIVIDGSPGTGCPVIASIGGVDLALIVTEPTLSGIHDLGRIVQVANHFKVPAAVCINKYDINLELTERIEAEAAGLGAKVIGKVRYDPAVTSAQIIRSSIVEYSGGLTAQQVRSLWRNVIYSLS